MRSLVASRLDGLIQEVASRAVEETGALLQPPLQLRAPRPPSTVPLSSADFDPPPPTLSAASGSASVEGAAALREQPVWGLDAYTRHNIRLVLEDDPSFQALVAALSRSPTAYGHARGQPPAQGPPADAAEAAAEAAAAAEAEAEAAAAAAAAAASSGPCSLGARER